MKPTQRISRRRALGTLAASATAAGVVPPTVSTAEAAEKQASALKGNIHHSVSKWCYGDIPLDEFCRAVKQMGIESVELLGPDDWPTVTRHGLTCAMCNGPRIDGIGGITRAFNRIEHHEKLAAGYQRRIPEVAKAGFRNVICFSGNREGLDDEAGLENCASGLKGIMSLAEKHKVTVCMELLNSRVDHPDYQCDHTEWGVELCKRVGSERFKLLYDIYHMQIMEGDIIRRIRNFSDYIAHYHTGGVPGRGEIDETQELNYSAVMRAIVETGYKGHVGQEFVPKRPDALASLRQAIEICDV